MSRMILPLATALAVAAPVAAQDPGSRATREYVQAAGQSDAFEMLEAQAVLAQSTDPRVRDYAQRMLRDHAESSRALQQATARSGLKPPPMGVSEDQGHLLGALQNMKGRDFDRAYLTHQALSHHAALTVDQRYAATGDTPSVRQVASSAVPTVSSHLSEVEQLRAQSGER